MVRCQTAFHHLPIRLTPPFCIPPASQDDLRNAFHSGDRDGDNTLSVREAVSAVQVFGGRTLDAKQLERACNDCGVATGREMDFDEFVRVVRKLEGEGAL
ncbi:hypothetical protein B0T13DRAFT_161398 [Neurospora crassa]|nr:hypothetical protein B0T13DRAFT_161398 [Neurospora crassa]